MSEFAGTNWTGNNDVDAAPHPAHPAREQLLLYADGELNDSESGQLKVHLDACWKCRGRLSEIEETITAFSRFDDDVLTACLPSPPNGWRGFDARLRQLAAANGAPSWRSRWRAWWTRALAGVIKSRWQPRWQPRWATAFALVVCLAAISFWLLRSAPVSARELLQRSIQAETASLQQVAEPVLYRKLQVRRKTARATESATWESWRSAKGDQFRQRIAEPQSAHLLAELEQILRFNHLDAQRPLSAATFAEWRNNINPKAESVTRLADELRLTVTVREPHALNAIIEASLVVRGSDWRAVALQAKVQGEQEIHFYELSEAAYDVLPLQALMVFADLAPTPAATIAPTVAPNAAPVIAAASPAPAVALPGNAALQAAEVAALYALHQAKADLGEQIEVMRDADKQIVVRGLVQTAARKEELTESLNRIAFVSAQIQTIEEAVQQAQRAANPPVTNETVTATGDSAVVGGQTAAAVNPIQQKLIEQFGGRKGLSDAEREEVNRQVTQFYNAVEADASAAMAEAWALRRLQERFNTPAGGGLDATSQQRLEEMFGNHVARLRQHSRSLQTRLRPLLIALSGEGSAPPQPAEVTRQAQIQAVFRAAEQTNRLTDQLIAGNTAASLPQTARALLTELARLDAALATLKNN